MVVGGGGGGGSGRVQSHFCDPNCGLSCFGVVTTGLNTEQCHNWS